ncbi:MAG: hypothetical protein WBK74_09355, partial [Limnochordia bacterium]
MGQVITKSRALKLLKKLKIFDQWDAAKWAYRQGWEIDKRNFIFWTVLNILGALIPVYSLRVIKEIIDYITANIAAGSLSDIAWRIGALCGLWVLQSSYHIIPEIIKYTMQTRYSIAMQRRYATFVGTIPLCKFDNSEFAAKISHVGSTCNRLAYVMGGTASFIGAFAGTVGLFWLAFTTSWLLLLIAAVFFAVALVLTGKNYRQHYDFWAVAKLEIRKQDYYAGLITGRESGKEIRAMKLNDFFRNRWRTLTEKLSEMQLDLDMKSAKVNHILGLIHLGFSILILGFG